MTNEILLILSMLFIFASTLVAYRFFGKAGLFAMTGDEVAVNALVKDDTIWLSQKAMAELFGCSTDNISLHLKNIFLDGKVAFFKK